MRSLFHTIMGKSGGASYGALTTAWIAETGETDVTILGALNTLETDLTTYGLISKMKVLYPFVGGSATKHKYNFANTALNEITWSGGITHSSTGVLGNGTNGYGSTGLIPSSVFSVGNLGGTFYSRTNRQLDYGCPFGCWDATSNPNNFILFHRYATNSTGIRCGNTGFTSTVATVTDSSGIFTMNRTDTINQSLYRNGISIHSGVLASTALPTNQIFVLAGNQVGSATYYDNEEFGFMAFHDGLTSGEVTTLYNAINTFKTTLSR